MLFCGKNRLFSKKIGKFTIFPKKCGKYEKNRFKNVEMAVSDFLGSKSTFGNRIYSVPPNFCVTICRTRLLISLRPPKSTSVVRVCHLRGVLPPKKGPILTPNVKMVKKSDFSPYFGRFSCCGGFSTRPESILVP